MGWNLLGQTWDTLRAHRLRSLLTVFGIMWGMISLVLMISGGEGFRVAQRNSVLTLGRDIMIIWGGRTSLQGRGYQAGRIIQLRYGDYQALREQAPLVLYASPEIIRFDLTAKSSLNSGTFGVHGVLPIYHYMRSISIRWGRALTEGDEKEARRVCVLGSETNAQLFEGGNSVGETLLLDGHPFTVVGVMPYKEQNSSYSGQDIRSIFIPYTTMARLFPNSSLGQDRDLLNNLIVMPVSGDRWLEAERQVREVLARRHHFDPADEDALFIWNTAQTSRMIDGLIRSMQQFMGAVGVVTLFLGAIGIINVMLISVRERTVEIGLRRSVGARRRDILLQFFSESFLLTSTAGALGLLVAWTLCALVNQLPLPETVFAGMVVSRELNLLALGVLACLGILAGVYPAYVAASMDPIEALRFEAN